MSENDAQPAATVSGITQAALDTAVANARADATASGATEAVTRLTSVLATDGIKGNAARMTAAVDLMAKSPAMSAEDVTAFITANVAGATAAPTTYEADRLNAVGLAAPQDGAGRKSKASINRAEIFGARRPKGGKE